MSTKEEVLKESEAVRNLSIFACRNKADDGVMLVVARTKGKASRYFYSVGLDPTLTRKATKQEIEHVACRALYQHGQVTT